MVHVVVQNVCFCLIWRETFSVLQNENLCIYFDQEKQIFFCISTFKKTMTPALINLFLQPPRFVKSKKHDPSPEYIWDPLPKKMTAPPRHVQIKSQDSSILLWLSHCQPILLNPWSDKVGDVGSRAIHITQVADSTLAPKSRRGQAGLGTG